MVKKKFQHDRIQVDNQQLDGFIDPFVKGTVPCVQGGKGCGSCKWCDQWMAAVTLPATREQRLAEVTAVLEDAKRGKGVAP